MTTSSCTRWTKRWRGLLVFWTVLVIGCPAAPPQSVPPGLEVHELGPTIGGRISVASAPAEPDATDVALGAEGAAKPTSTDARGEGGVAGRAAIGASCWAATECQSGVCEGAGCTSNAPGVCVAASRVCYAALTVFCDCQGQQFQAPGDCPGQRHLAATDCTAPSASAPATAPPPSDPPPVGDLEAPNSAP